jgi:Domain of Unknown Function (DUF1080)
MNRPISMFIGAMCLSLMSPKAQTQDSAWVNLLADGLTGWTNYFQKNATGVAKDTWKITPEGWLHVDIQVDFNTSGFGHLFWTKRKLSYYIVRAEYRFPTNSYGPNWGQGWNRENNGLMLHSQDPATMGGKDFPTSIEVQLLGKNNEQNAQLKSQGFKYASSANMCSPGTFIAYNGNANFTTHCTNSVYPNAWKNTDIPFEDPAGWSDVTVRVLADSLVQHFIHSQKVMEYTRLRLDNGTPLKEGYLSVQAEGTSTQFRKLEILDLVGCMTQGNPAYRSYFVKHDAAACNTTGVGSNAPNALAKAQVKLQGNRLALEGFPVGSLRAEIVSTDGRTLAVVEGSEALALPAGLPAFFLVRIHTSAGILQAKLARP